MKTREDVVLALAQIMPGVRERYKVGSVELFGSFSRAEQAETSDVDLAVEFTGPMSYRQHAALEQELSRAVGARVDIVDRAGLRPRIRARVEREAIRL